VTDRHRTLGQAIADVTRADAAAIVALLLVIVGSLGPWVTTPLTSASGTSGDGWFTILMAILGGWVVWRHGPGRPLAIIAGIILAEGMYEVIHLHQAVARVTFNGLQLDHVGWGVYAVIAGAAGVLAVVWRDLRSQRT